METREPFRPGGSLNVQWKTKLEPAHNPHKSLDLLDQDSNVSIHDKLFHHSKVCRFS
jgi:hypothetical protein